jgi:hypothetical protein
LYDIIEQRPGYTVSRKRYNRTDPRLGRHVRHDSRSLAYLVKAKDPAQLKSIRHERHIPTLDQGSYFDPITKKRISLGSCTGNAATGALGSGVFWEEGLNVLSPIDIDVDETFAVGVYAEATKLDPFSGDYPPTDTGSDGLSVAQVLKNRGLISGYVHATSFDAALTALSQTPVIGGVEWRQDMFRPDPDGRIHITGSIAGGHEIVFDELDVENQRVWFHNSWGPNWGVHGRAYLTWGDFKTLLSRQGDITQFVPVTEPAPTPDPNPPVPQPAPVTPDVTLIQEVIDACKNLVAALEKFLNPSKP